MLFHDQNHSPAKQQQMAKAEWFCFLVKTNLFFGVIRYVKKEDISKPLLKKPTQHPTSPKGTSKVTGLHWGHVWLLQGHLQLFDLQLYPGTSVPRELQTRSSWHTAGQKWHAPCYDARKEMVDQIFMIKNVKAGKREKPKKVWSWEDENITWKRIHFKTMTKNNF